MTMEREEAIKILADLIDNIFLHTWEKQNKALHMAIEALQFVEHFDLLKEFQSLQEVVRCKDCKHLYEDNGCPLRTWHTHVLDDYCSYGELKGGDDE